MKSAAWTRHGQLLATFAITGLSRAIGVGREALIAILFGFTDRTDLFYQVTFVPTMLLMLGNGPFTTAFVGSLSWDISSKAAQLRWYRRRALLCAGFVGLAFAVGASIGSAFGIANLNPEEILIGAGASSGAILLGYNAAALTACGEIPLASAALLMSNAVFVLGIATLTFLPLANSRSVLPLIYCISTLIAAVASWMILSNKIQAYTREAPSADPKGIASLPKTLMLSSSESGVFAITQAVVLALAATAGTGWTSAASLTQRITFSVIGLIVGPAASYVMILLRGSRKDRVASTFFNAMMLTLGLLSSIAIILILGRGQISAMIAAHSKVTLSAAAQLSSLMPGFAIWMVAMGANAVLCRAMFALHRGSYYVRFTIFGYFIAIVTRVLFARVSGFAAAVTVGATIELLVVLGLAFFEYRILQFNQAGRPEYASG